MLNLSVQGGVFALNCAYLTTSMALFHVNRQKKLSRKMQRVIFYVKSAPVSNNSKQTC